MSKVNDGGAAFPMLGNVGYKTDWDVEPGMSLRDYFAAQALAGIATTCGFQGGPWDKLAKDAYAAADAMIAARNAPTE